MTDNNVIKLLGTIFTQVGKILNNMKVDIEVDTKINNVDVIDNKSIDNKNINKAKCICENGTSYEMISTSDNIRQNVDDFLEKYKNCDCTLINN